MAPFVIGRMFEIAAANSMFRYTVQPRKATWLSRTKPNQLCAP
ncbi:uncharacterized protein EKO05_0008062 [Ascochyta rabiei]|nr:uncharacterized protein EKO05_0008062 [Ascochyta rabiei]UPX17722.1 hypothetical protein EKO05_0008062 [Ascochyta rabiei]